MKWKRRIMYILAKFYLWIGALNEVEERQVRTWLKIQEDEK